MHNPHVMSELAKHIRADRLRDAERWRRIAEASAHPASTPSGLLRVALAVAAVAAALSVVLYAV